MQEYGTSIPASSKASSSVLPSGTITERAAQGIDVYRARPPGDRPPGGKAGKGGKGGDRKGKATTTAPPISQLAICGWTKASPTRTTRAIAILMPTVQRREVEIGATGEGEDS